MSDTDDTSQDKNIETSGSSDEKQKKYQKFRTPKGVHDILPEDHQYYTFIKKAVRHRCRQAGMKRITTPIFEESGVFERSVGADTDIVSKEMYTFTDKKGKTFALRPEGTAGVVRSYIQHGMGSLPQPVELYYFEPFFRYDRPQKGRYRQFFQYGVEIIGESEPALDTQVIYLVHLINKDLGIADQFTIQLNTIGCRFCRPKYVEDLKNYYFGKERNLCESCKNRIETNPLRLLDCKEEDCQILASLAPKIDQYLCEECKSFHEKVCDYLDELDLKYVKNPNLVRGLDYYTKTVFEFWDKSSGAQNAIGGGGRYDGLVELLGGPPTPAVGVSVGIERLIYHMKEHGVQVPFKDNVHVFLAQLGPEAKKKSLKLLYELRDNGIKTVGALGKGSMKAQLRLADKFNADYALILGQMEVLEGNIILRDMKAGRQELIKQKNVIPELIKRVGEKNLDILNGNIRSKN